MAYTILLSKAHSSFSSSVFLSKIYCLCHLAGCQGIPLCTGWRVRNSSRSGISSTVNKTYKVPALSVVVTETPFNFKS